MKSNAKYFVIIGAILTWFGVITQFPLHLQNSDFSFAEKLIRFFTYFTILTNILAAVCFTCLWLFPSSKWGRFFSKPEVITAIAVYIVVVGTVYNTVLRSVWNPTGLQRVVDEVLHTVNPSFFLLFWIVCVPKQSLTWSHIPKWLIYPLVYCIVIILRGAASGFYPYPFMDVAQFGYMQVAINSLVVTGVFLLFAAVFVGVGRMSRR